MQGRTSRERAILQEIVERIGWVYAGLWQPLPPNNSMVVWAEGYYNGPTMENGEAPLPSSALWNQRKSRRRILEELQAMPEARLTSDLSYTEWFYLLSSKFEFQFGQDGTPAKLLLTDDFEWICDGDEVNGAMFTRTPLVKAAGMKTVLCLAVPGGVVEIGTTALVDQNMQLVQFVSNMFQRGLGAPKVPPASSLLGHEQTDDHSDNGLLFSASSATAKFSSPTSTTLGISNPGLPNASAGRGLVLAPPYQTNLTGPGPLQQISSFGLDSLSFAPSLLNGLIREQGPELNLQQAATAGSWDLSVEQHLMQEQNMTPANLKHKLTGPTSALTKSGSCVASFEQALFPHAQPIPPRGAQPVESTRKLLSDFRTQLFSPTQLQQQNNLVQNSAETVVNDSPRHSPVVPPLADSMKHAQSPDIHWRTVAQPKGLASPRKLLRVESGKGLGELSKVEDTSFKCHQLGSPSEDSLPHNFTDLLPNSNHGHGQQTQFLAELTGEAHTGQSADHSWSSEAISPTISEQEQEPEDGFSLWEDSETLENGRFLDGPLKHERSKKARLCGVGVNGHHSNGTTNDFGNFLDYNMTERKRQDHKKLEVLRAMLQPHSVSKGDKAAILGDAAERMRDLQRRVKESESTTTSSASDDGQNPRSLERSSSLTTNLVNGVNHVNMRRDYNHRNSVRQQQYGRSVGGDNGPLLKLSDVCLDTSEELDGVVLGVVDDIPQIEVRMMENDHVMIKLSSKDRPNLFTDIMFALQDLHLQVQHANIRTVHGVVHDVFAAKVDVALLEKQSTHTIAEAIRQAIERGNSPSSCSPNPATPDANPNVNSPRKRSLQLS